MRKKIVLEKVHGLEPVPTRGHEQWTVAMFGALLKIYLLTLIEIDFNVILL